MQLQLRLLLILNDLYQPFFRLGRRIGFGNKTAKQIANLPIFLSFTVMALSVFQTSLETRNYSFLKNYPKFSHREQHIRKFDEFDGEMARIKLANLIKEAQAELVQQHTEDEQTFLDFYDYLQIRQAPQTPYPTVFNQIYNSKLKEDTINLYKTFEQIVPMLIAEVQQKVEHLNLINKGESEPIIHLQVDRPFQNWTDQNQTFDPEKEHLLNNWEFDDSDLVVRDLKQDQQLTRTYSIIQQFLLQYKDYVNKHLQREPAVADVSFVNYMKKHRQKGVTEAAKAAKIQAADKVPVYLEPELKTVVTNRPRPPQFEYNKVLYTPVRPYYTAPSISELNKNTRIDLDLEHLERRLSEIEELRGPLQDIPSPSDTQSHEEIYDFLQTSSYFPFPLTREMREFDFFDLKLAEHLWTVYPKINDKIPHKMQGINVFELPKPRPYVFSREDHQYQKRRTALLRFSKEGWKRAVSKINAGALDQTAPSLWEYCSKKDSTSLSGKIVFSNSATHRLNLVSAQQRQIFKFLELLVTQLNVRHYALIVQNFFALADVPHLARLNHIYGDLEMVYFPGQGKKSLRRKRLYFYCGKNDDPKVIYQQNYGVKIKSYEEQELEKYVLKQAMLYPEHQRLFFPIYKFYKYDSHRIITKPESRVLFNIDPYAFYLDDDEEYDVDGDEIFQEWRKNKHNEIFDHYLNNTSSVSKSANDNPHLKKFIDAEDYLLEALLDMVKRYNIKSELFEAQTQLIEAKNEFDEKVEEEEEEEEYVFDEKAEEEKEEAEKLAKKLSKLDFGLETELAAKLEAKANEEIGPLKTASLIFDFFRNRKQERDLLLKNAENSMVDNQNQKRKLEFAFVYDILFKNLDLYSHREASEASEASGELPLPMNFVKVKVAGKVKRPNKPLEPLEDEHKNYIWKRILLPRIPHNVRNPAIVFIQNEKDNPNHPYKYDVVDASGMPSSVAKKITGEEFDEETVWLFPILSQKDIEAAEAKAEAFKSANVGVDFYNQLLTVMQPVVEENIELEEPEEPDVNDDLVEINDFGFIPISDHGLLQFNKFEKQKQKQRKQTGDLIPISDLGLYQLKNATLLQMVLHRQMSNQPTPMNLNGLLLRQPEDHRVFRSHNNLQFFELRENINDYSWSLIFFFTSGWVFVNIFKNVYKKYAKEIVESGIDFLQKAGILDDVKWLKEELGMSDEQAYRGIRRQGQKLKNIIGLNRKYIILQLSEMVWFLKTKKLFKVQSAMLATYVKPKGFLLTGPPGTGKTLLVQAVAGETGVPIVTQSGGLLQNPRLRGRGAQTLHKLFVRAREIAPCIIFIDEVDGIGSRRQFQPDPEGGYDVIEFLEKENDLHLPPQNIVSKRKVQRRFEFWDDSDPYWKEPEFTQTLQSPRFPIDVLQDMYSSRSARNEQISILTQLLIEMDGLHPLDNILVIGATNRVGILDPALLRPGRFQRILKFTLPDYNARIKLLKLYTQSSKIGIENISWDYFSKRTQGLSAADIASIVFASELTAVQLAQKHTLASLERGIDLITSFPSDPAMLRMERVFVFLNNLIYQFFRKNHFYQSLAVMQIDRKSETKIEEISHIIRNCYYNIGKMFIIFCLQIESLASIHLWERPKNFRFLRFTQKFNEFAEQKRFSRIEAEKRLLAFFGGKAGESLFIFLPLQTFCPEVFFQFDATFISFANSLEQSNFGIENEIQQAQNLLQLMVEKWYFYLEKIATEKFHPIMEDANLWEYPEKEILVAQALVEEMMIDLDMRNRLSRNEQKHSYKTWWMKKVATQLNFHVQMGIGNEVDNLLWSRIYLSDPDNSAQNIEWVAPDEYFHTLFRTRSFCMSWAQFLENGRFAISNLLLLQSFNTVFKTLRQFSEFIDFLADYFLRHESIRETDLNAKISQFFNDQI